MERAQTQYTVSVKNEVGQLRKLMMSLTQEQVPVLAVAWQAEGDTGFIRFVTDRGLGVAPALARLGWTAVQTPVHTVAVPTRPGELGRLLKLFDDAGLNVLEMYGSAEKGDTCRMVIAVDRPEIAEKLLNAYTETMFLASR
ncbi:hypothetical protein EPO15_13890 [bacterium]|nr:MAG: hypothetical protein EPO15_13890 [bacterium]